LATGLADEDSWDEPMSVGLMIGSECFGIVGASGGYMLI